ncbi:hypothetical protein JHD46_01255 [Sulfurimonas sp. SAG-AH-194-C20]|nr:Ig-like domain-containing protein [Sulfurimonas sp. SAG-AH-194-C20]MDF1878260.1 hypothetical protein [Sulfurimonas sp. SAG-AH-194-C20]
MRLTFLITISLILSSSLVADSIFSKTYEGCASSKREALYTLSGNIQSRISTHIEQTIVLSNEKDIKSKVSDYSSSTTNLSLVNIEYKKQKNEICAVVNKDAQVKNTNKLLSQALLYDAKNLPKDTDVKIEKLSTWISNIKQLSFLIPAFLNEQDTSIEQSILNQKEKSFTDIYTKSIAYSNSLFFRSCKTTKEKAKIALNEVLFPNTKKDAKKSFIDSIANIFVSNDSTKMLDIFDAQIIEVKKDEDICLMIKKEELLGITQKMHADVMRVSEASLSKNPLKRYKNIENNLYEQLDVTRALMKNYSSVYKSNDFSQLDKKRKLLENIQAKTFPQYIVFNISGGTDIAIILDKKRVKNNEKYYVQDGEHTYKITSKGNCPLVDTFKSDLFQNKTVSEDLSGQEYPTVIFQTDKEPNIVINGRVVVINMTQIIKQCEGTARYVVKYANQNSSGEIETIPGAKNTVSLDFLTKEELAIFNDAKTKNFTTTSEAMFAETLTPLNSEKFEFSITREPMNGEVTLHKSGSFQYISKKGFTGLDNFEYEITTPDKTSAPKLVAISVGVSLFPTLATAKVEENLTNPQKAIIQSTPQNKLDTLGEQKYQKWKKVVMSQDIGNVDFLNMLKQKYPSEFQRLREEMINK